MVVASQSGLRRTMVVAQSVIEENDGSGTVSD